MSDEAEAERRAEELLAAGWTRSGDRWAARSDLHAIVCNRGRRRAWGLSLDDAWAFHELIGATRRHAAERFR